MKSLFTLVINTFKEFSNDQAMRLAAATAYYTLFSIAPLLVIAIAVAGLVFGRSAAEGQIVGQISSTIGQQAAQTIQGMVARANNTGSSIWATVIGIVLLLFGASGVFSSLQNALNTIWDVKQAPGQGLGTILKNRLFTFTLVLGIGFLLLVSLLISAAISALSSFFRSLAPGVGSTFLLGLINFVVSFAIITLLFALMYKYLPDAEISWRHVWPGALFTALLFTIGKSLISLYLAHSSVASVYGAAGSLAVILIWLYYSAVILYFGAEFTQVFARRHGEVIQPKRGAIPISAQPEKAPAVPSRPRARRAGAPLQPVPVTSGQPDQLYSEAPEYTMPPMPQPVKVFSGVVGALVAALGLSGLMFARSRGTRPNRMVSRRIVERRTKR